MGEDRRQQVAEGRTTVGIELGSTRIKAVLIDDEHRPIASGDHEWENAYVDGRWTYSLEAVESGLQAAYAALVADVEAQYGVRPTTFRAAGVSAMMHGYLAFDADDELLVPFRTWRNTSTGPASAALSERLDFTVPLRWSVAHLYQAVLDEEPHVAELARVTTLAGYVHRRLTGRDVLGVGDASGMFPIDSSSRDYDAAMLQAANDLIGKDVRALFPEVLVAGQDAGTLTPEGAEWLDPTGTLEPGVPLCPPEGDAGTGMVATNAVAPRTGNVSVGTSIFAMVVLEHPLGARHEELDVVTTPAGDAVAMVHCNNGASEIASWARVFGRFADAAAERTGGASVDIDDVYATLLAEAADADPDAGGLLSYNYLAGEPVTGVEDGRPVLVRSPGGRFTLGNLIRAEVQGAFATLAIGMDVLQGESVAVDRMTAHGGLFRTPGTPQRLLAAALDVPVALEDTAGEGGAWGIAVLAAYGAERSGTATTGAATTGTDATGTDATGTDATSTDTSGTDLTTYLADRVFGGGSVHVAEPDADDVAGFRAYLERFRAGLPLQAAAVAATSTGTSTSTSTSTGTSTGTSTSTSAGTSAGASTAPPAGGATTDGAEPSLPTEKEPTR